MCSVLRAACRAQTSIVIVQRFCAALSAFRQKTDDAKQKRGRIRDRAWRSALACLRGACMKARRKSGGKTCEKPRRIQEGKRKRRCRCRDKSIEARAGSVLAARTLAAKVLVVKVRATALRNRGFQAPLRNGKRPATVSFALFWRLQVFAARFFVSSCSACPCRGWMVFPFRRL